MVSIPFVICAEFGLRAFGICTVYCVMRRQKNDITDMGARSKCLWYYRVYATSLVLLCVVFGLGNVSIKGHYGCALFGFSIVYTKEALRL